MKIFVGFMIFISTLALTSTSFANEETHAANSESHQASAQAEGHQAKKGERDNFALFPPKQPDHALGTEPGTPELVGPEFMKKIKDSSAKLEWKAVEGAESYHVQVATDPNFKWLTLDEHFVKETSVQVNNLEAGKQYFWRVAAKRPNNMPSHTKSFFSKSSFETVETK